MACTESVPVTICPEMDMYRIEPNLHGLFQPWTFISWTISSIDYFDNIFCIIKADRVQSNHLLLDPQYYVFKQRKIW